MVRNDTMHWEAVHKGLQLNRNLRISGAIRREVVAMISSLTDREEQVLRLVTEGHANKQIAAELGVSLRSVEKWPKEGLEKLNIESPLQLLRILMRAGFQEWPGRMS
jgi:FixJ family two-component response regulator